MEVKRATLEKVVEYQEELIFGETGIDTLAKLEETVAPESRSIFFRNLAYSLLGKGLTYQVILDYKEGTYDLGCVSEFARKIVYYTDTTDKKQEIILKGIKTRVPIKYLWVALRESFYKPMDEALTLALRSSAEVLGGGGDSYGFRPETKIQ